MVPPKERTSTPASVVSARRGRSRAAAALASRAPSTCRSISCSWAQLGQRADLLGRVDGAELGRLGDRDDARLGRRARRRPGSIRSATSSGVSLPSGVGTARSFTPAIRSGAPHSSTFRCAVSGQITASWGRASAWSARTLAPVPLKTRNASACSPKCSRKRSARGGRVVVVAVGGHVARRWPRRSRRAPRGGRRSCCRSRSRAGASLTGEVIAACRSSSRPRRCRRRRSPRRSARRR